MNESIYTKAWYDEARALFGAEYRALADILYDSFKFKTVLDVGCGAGFILERLLTQWGVTVRGIDGSACALEAAAEVVRPFLSVQDLRVPVEPWAPTYDLVICTEVAEHLEAKHANTLVESCVAFAAGPIYFTAAPPGQGGTDHINEQEPLYWITKFEARSDKTLNRDLSARINRLCALSLPRMPWFAFNGMVFM
jgi:SAM-dependent methyltransferase